MVLYNFNNTLFAKQYDSYTKQPKLKIRLKWSGILITNKLFWKLVSCSFGKKGSEVLTSENYSFRAALFDLKPSKKNWFYIRLLSMAFQTHTFKASLGFEVWLRYLLLLLNVDVCITVFRFSVKMLWNDVYWRKRFTNTSDIQWIGWLGLKVILNIN